MAVAQNLSIAVCPSAEVSGRSPRQPRVRHDAKGWIVKAVDSRIALDTRMTIEALTTTAAERLAGTTGCSSRTSKRKSCATRKRWGAWGGAAALFA